MVKLRKDLVVEKKSLGDAVGYYLHEPALKNWTETFVDEDTGEKTEIERCNVLASPGTLIDDATFRELESHGIKEVLVRDEKMRAVEVNPLFCDIDYYQVKICSTEGNVVLIVRAQSVVLAAQAAADYAESDPINVFGTVCNFFITDVKSIVGLHFINRTKEDLQKEREALEKDADAPLKTPFRVKAQFVEAVTPNNLRTNKKEYVVWAYDVRDAREIVISYMHEIYGDNLFVKGRDTSKVTNAIPYIKHIFVPAFVCNAYISEKQQWLSTANDIVTND